MENIVNGKTILVTGGTGSIGSEIVRQLLKFNPHQVRVFSRDQSKQLFLQNELKEYLRAESPNIRFLIGDIREKDRVKKAMHGVNIVIHAAALKHVASCEYNPFETVKTNVYGLQNVLEAAVEEDVEKFVYISTDKAAGPINIMGLTKSLGEKMAANTYYYQGPGRATFASVRFGNVLNSAGSVVPLFIEQIKKGGPITITHPEMKRFFMSIPQAARLVLDALKYSQVNETFVLKMPTIKIIDLAEVLIRKLAGRYGHNPNDIKIEFIGKSAGERIDERLMTEEEADECMETKEFFVIRPKLLIPYKKGHIPEYKVPDELKVIDIKSNQYNTTNSISLTQEEIEKILSKEGII